MSPHPGVYAWVPGKPVPWARPRCVVRGKFPSFFEDKSVTAYRRAIADTLAVAMSDHPMMTGPLSASMTFTFEHPAAQWRKRTPLRRAWRPKRPDIDNLSKCVLDAAEGVVFEDDGAIVELNVRKMSCAQGDEPGLVVSFRTLEPLDAVG